MIKLCQRCGGNGFVATKNGVKPCPMCRNKPQRTPQDWRYNVLGLGVYVGLVLLTLWGMP